jgi:hypothetical protein
LVVLNIGSLRRFDSVVNDVGVGLEVTEVHLVLIGLVTTYNDHVFRLKVLLLVCAGILWWNVYDLLIQDVAGGLINDYGRLLVAFLFEEA